MKIRTILKSQELAVLLCVLISLSGCHKQTESVEISHLSNEQTSPDARAFMDFVSDSIAGAGITPSWMADGASFWYEDNESAGTYRWFNADNGEVGLAFDMRSISSALAAKGIDNDDSYEPVDYFPAQQKLRLLINEQDLIELDLKTDEIKALKDQPTPIKTQRVRKSFPIANWDRFEILSPDKQSLATLDNYNVGVRQPNSPTKEMLTTDGAVDNEYMFASDLWENSGSSWSPDSRYLLARRHDMTGVTAIPIVGSLETNETVQPFKYWARAGQPLPITTFYIFDRKNNRVTEVPASLDHDHLALYIDWSPNSDEFTYIRYARDLSSLELIAVNPATGAKRTLLKEQREKGWVKWPGGPQTLTYLPSGDGFIWRSEREGFFQYYLYQRDGTLLRKLTREPHPVHEVVAIDESSNWLYFMASSDGAHPYDRHLNRIKLSGGTAQQLTKIRGQHSITMSPDHDYFLSEHSHLSRPPRVDLYRANGGLIRTLAKARVAPGRDNWPSPEEFVVKAADGITDVHGVIFKPLDFDPTQNYPVIERIYGGMQANVVRRVYPGHNMSSAGADYHKMLQYYNQQGFVVVAMDTPGTPGRGREFNLRTHGSWPDGIINDHAAGLEQLIKRTPYMDRQRVAIDGNSWGGLLATRALIEAPELYRAAVATVPETDFLDHVHWIEFQNGTPQNNPKAYEGGTPDQATLIQGKLLLIHGTADVNVPFSNTLKLVNALIAADKDFELLVVPGVNHSLQGNGERYSYAVKRSAMFFEKSLNTCNNQ